MGCLFVAKNCFSINIRQVVTSYLVLFLILFIDKYIRGGDYFSGNSAAPSPKTRKKVE